MQAEHFSISSLGAILLTACLVAIASRRLRIPYTVGLVLAGIALSGLPQIVALPLSRELIFTVFLPPLVFQAATEIRWDDFRGDLPTTALFATLGVLISALVVAAGTHFLLGWSWLGSAFFGVLIAATDPVAVIATFNELHTDRRLKVIVESESLLNDGIAAVGFGVLVEVALGSSGSPAGIAGDLMLSIVGGIACGIGIGAGLLIVSGRTEDHLVEITLTTLAAYGSFLVADRFGMSGVLASLTAGLLIGNRGWRHALSEGGRDEVRSFWEYAAFLANSVIFILIGGRATDQPLAFFSKSAAICVVLVLAARALTVYPLSAVLRPTRLRMSGPYQHVLFWGGLRGAMALALALSLPEQVVERQEIIAVTFAVVALSILTQGISMPWLIRRLGLWRGDASSEKS